jgi:hypothetical protein
MSRDGSESQLKGLEGVSQRLLDKLEGAGVQSVSDLATSTASELLEEYYSNYDDSGIGIVLETMSQAVMKAKQKLIEDGLLQKDFSSAENMLETISVSSFAIIFSLGNFKLI